ncbi:MAG: sulfurtransferase TusA family protein [Pseudomonadota bacterium]
MDRGDLQIGMISKTVDCVGQKCPLPVLRARKALGLQPKGALVEVLSNDPVALLDIPHMARECGHELVDQSVDGEVARFVIRRG